VTLKKCFKNKFIGLNYIEEPNNDSDIL